MPRGRQLSEAIESFAYLLPFAATKEKGRDCQNHEHHEEDFRNASSTGGKSPKTEQRRNQRDDQKYDSVVKHRFLQ